MTINLDASNCALAFNAVDAKEFAAMKLSCIDQLNGHQSSSSPCDELADRAAVHQARQYSLVRF